MILDPEEVELLRHFPVAWWTLRPRQELVTDQSEDRRTHVAVAASEDGKLLVA
ncbi:MAG: hypothetical protein OXN89_19330 [Bryobacterales bacterium]|nr:hypothetical protein [Bryobacterales bacterium]